MLQRSRKTKMRFFLIIYMIAAFSKLQANLFVPYYENDYIYLLYVFIICILAILTNPELTKIRITPALVAGGAFTLFVLLWGFVFTNNEYKDMIYENGVKMIFLLAFVILTAYLVNYYRCQKEFLITTYLVQILFVIHLVILNFNEIHEIEWIYNLQHLTETGHKDKLGFGTHANILGLIILITFAYGLLLKEFYCNRRKIFSVIHIFLWSIILIISARMELICCILLYAMVYIQKKACIKVGQWLRALAAFSFSIIVIFVIVCMNIDYFEDIVMKMNRYYAIAYYLQLFSYKKKWLFGLGYVNYSRLPDLLVLNGFKMTFSECTWIDILVTSGFIGLLWIMMTWIYIIKKSLLSDMLITPVKKTIAFSMCISVLLNGLSEGVGFLDSYWINYAFLTLLFVFLFSCNSKNGTRTNNQA